MIFSFHALQAGWHDIRLECYEGVKSANVKLEYASAGTPRQVVPSDHLRPPTATPTS